MSSSANKSILNSLLARLESPTSSLCADIEKYLDPIVASGTKAPSKKPTASRSSTSLGPSAWSILVRIQAILMGLQPNSAPNRPENSNSLSQNLLFWAQIVKVAFAAIETCERQLTLKDFDVDKLMANILGRFSDLYIEYAEISPLLRRIFERLGTIAEPAKDPNKRSSHSNLSKATINPVIAVPSNPEKTLSILVISNQISLIKFSLRGEQVALMALDVLTAKEDGGLFDWINACSDKELSLQYLNLLWWSCRRDMLQIEHSNTLSQFDLCLWTQILSRPKYKLDSTCLFSKATIAYYQKLQSKFPAEASIHMAAVAKALQEQNALLFQLFTAKFGVYSDAALIHPLTTLICIFDRIINEPIDQNFPITYQHPAIAKSSLANVAAELRVEFSNALAKFKSWAIDNYKKVSIRIWCELLTNLVQLVDYYNFDPTELNSARLFSARILFDVYKSSTDKDPILLRHCEKYLTNDGNCYHLCQFAFYVGANLISLSQYRDSIPFLSISVDKAEDKEDPKELIKRFDLLTKACFKTDEYFAALQHLNRVLDLHFGQEIVIGPHITNSTQTFDMLPILVRWWKCATKLKQRNEQLEWPRQEFALLAIVNGCKAMVNVSDAARLIIRQIAEQILKMGQLNEETIKTINHVYSKTWKAEDLQFLLQINGKQTFYYSYWSFLAGESICAEIDSKSLTVEQSTEISCMLVLSGEYLRAVRFDKFAQNWIHRFLMIDNCSEQYGQSALEAKLSEAFTCILQGKFKTAYGLYINCLFDEMDRQNLSKYQSILTSLECLENIVRLCIEYFGVIKEATKFCQLAMDICSGLPKLCCYYKTIFKLFHSTLTDSKEWKEEVNDKVYDPFCTLELALIQSSHCILEDSFDKMQDSLKKCKQLCSELSFTSVGLRISRMEANVRLLCNDKSASPSTTTTYISDYFIEQQVGGLFDACRVDQELFKKPQLYIENSDNSQCLFEEHLSDLLELAHIFCGRDSFSRIVFTVAAQWPFFKWNRLNLDALIQLLEAAKSREYRLGNHFESERTPSNLKWSKEECTREMELVDTFNSKGGRALFFSFDKIRSRLYVHFRAQCPDETANDDVTDEPLCATENKLNILLCIPITDDGGERDEGNSRGCLYRQMMVLEDLMKENRETLFLKGADISVSDPSFKRQWWGKRKELDGKLVQFIKKFETEWLGLLVHYKALLGRILFGLDSTKVSTFKDTFEQVILREYGIQLNASSIFCAFLLGFGPSPKVVCLEKIIDLVEGTFRFKIDSRAQLIRTLKKCYECIQDDGENLFFEDNSLANLTILNEPVLLILDKQLHFFPWEATIIFKELPVYRVPSLFHLSQCIHSVGPKKIPVSYLLNPSGDLKNTQSTFEPRLKERPWSGIIARPPNSKEFLAALVDSQIFLYFGHGAGEMYIKGEEIKEQSKGKCAPSFLVGCSSGKLKIYQEHFCTKGTVLNYLEAGAPCVLVNLWDVTDKDIDRLTDAVLSKMGLWEKDEEEGYDVGTAVSESRDQCLLQAINGAAPVVYGIPFKWRQNCK